MVSKEKGEGKLGGDGAEAAGGEFGSAEGKPLLTDRAAAVIAELGLRVTPVKAQSSRDRVLRSLALGYAAQPADVAHLDSIARGAGVKIKEILGFARAQLEAEKSLAAADVNPIMEDDRTRRRRYARAQDEANKPVKAPTVLEQLQPTRFGKLRHLYLDGNPFCLRPHYRLAVLAALPALTMLDGEHVTATMREKAAAYSRPTPPEALSPRRLPSLDAALAPAGQAELRVALGTLSVIDSPSWPRPAPE